MHEDLCKAKHFLIDGDKKYTLVVCKGDTLYTSIERGVKPLVTFLDEEVNLEGFCAADKVVGAAAAYLYVLLKVRAVFAVTISEKALVVLNRYGVECEYLQTVPAIKNRTNTGFCPMESAVEGVQMPTEALDRIKAKIIELRKEGK